MFRRPNRRSEAARQIDLDIVLPPWLPGKPKFAKSSQGAVERYLTRFRLQREGTYINPLYRRGENILHPLEVIRKLRRMDEETLEDTARIESQQEVISCFKEIEKHPDKETEIVRELAKKVYQNFVNFYSRQVKHLDRYQQQLAIVEKVADFFESLETLSPVPVSEEDPRELITKKVPVFVTLEILVAALNIPELNPCLRDGQVDVRNTAVYRALKARDRDFQVDEKTLAELLTIPKREVKEEKAKKTRGDTTKIMRKQSDIIEGVIEKILGLELMGSISGYNPAMMQMDLKYKLNIITTSGKQHPTILGDYTSAVKNYINNINLQIEKASINKELNHELEKKGIRPETITSIVTAAKFARIARIVRTGIDDKFTRVLVANEVTDGLMFFVSTRPDLVAVALHAGLGLDMAEIVRQMMRKKVDKFVNQLDKAGEIHEYFSNENIQEGIQQAGIRVP